MNERTNPLQGILDIQPPTAPWQYALEANALDIVITILVSLSLLLSALFLIWRHFFSSKGRAHRKISNLKKHYRAEQISDKYAAFQLAQILRDALHLTQLSTRTALPNALQIHKNRWQRFITTLSAIRYAKKDDSQEKLTELIDDAYFWLRHWPKND